MTDETSNQAYDILDKAAADLRTAGLTGPAPWRVMIWTSFDRIREELCARHAAADLKRVRDMLDKHLRELAGLKP